MSTDPWFTLHVTAKAGSRPDQHPHGTNAAPPREAPERALVLGGGGSTGNAWMIGVIAGLYEAGLDVTDADLIIGTSAGSTTAAQVAASTPTELLADVLSAAPPPGAVRATRTGTVNAGVGDHLARTNRIIAAADDPVDMRRRMGVAALELNAESDASASEQWRATVAARLPSRQWPTRAMLVVAVDARTAQPVVFDRHSGLELADAIAASCASGRAHRIGPEQYIDGGYRRNENADLAAGYQRVLVLSPFGGRSRHPMHWRMQLAAQVEELRAVGIRVETVLPEPDEEHLFGLNAMNPSLRPAAALAGADQGRALATRLSEFWR